MEQSPSHLALTLSTKLEDEFVSPVTAIRSALEILRDFPDLDDAQRSTFVSAAIAECGRLERGVSDLADAVYAAAEDDDAPTPRPVDPRFDDRIQLHEADAIADLDFSDFQFNDSATVNAFYDAIEAKIDATERDWWFAVNHKNCRVFPEAWVAFAHRAKRISVSHAHGVVRYAEDQASAAADGSDMLPSRDAAIARLREMKTER